MGPVTTEGQWKTRDSSTSVKVFLISTSTHHEGENALTLICAHTHCSLCLTLHCMCSWDRLRLSDESPLYHPWCASIYSPVIPEGGKKVGQRKGAPYFYQVLVKCLLSMSTQCTPGGKIHKNYKYLEFDQLLAYSTFLSICSLIKIYLASCILLQIHNIVCFLILTHFFIVL